MSDEAKPVNQFPSGAELSPREKLECQKLEVELAALKRPFWQRGGFWAAALPLAVLLTGTLISWASGWFDLKQLEIKNANTLLQAANERLLAEKEELTSETQKLDASKIALHSDLQKLSDLQAEGHQDVALLTNRIHLLERQRDEKEDLISNLNIRLSDATKENIEARRIATKFDELQTARDRAESDSVELRYRLNLSYERTREVITNAGSALSVFDNVLINRDTKTLYDKETASLLLALGKWRAEYEDDNTKFRLSELAVSTDASTNYSK